MQVESAEELVNALRASGLLTGEQLEMVALDLVSFRDDLKGGLRHLINRERITHYQLGKVVRGKAANLIVGPYIILDKLSEGAVGKVYRARHARLDRTVALKVIRSSLISNPVVRGRYAREVEAISKLDHPNIVRVDDAGEADGKFYLAMEFVDGIDLARLMHDYEQLDVVEACEYARQAALGLQHAHEAGIVHRDVKPRNIVVAGERHLRQATEPSVVKILDLGLSRAMDPDDMVVPNLTRDHAVLGTPDYMAPEQAKNSRLVDARADLYSLGCTLYFLLTGRPPYPEGDAIEKLTQHQVGQPTPLQALRPAVPTAVAELVAKLMAKSPERRFATAGEVAAALEPHARYTGGSSVPVHGYAAPSSGDTAPGRTVKVSGSSVGPDLCLDLPPEPVPTPHPVVPSDATSPLRGLAEVLPVIESRAEGGSTRRHSAPGRSHDRPASVPDRNPGVVKLVLIAVAVVILIMLAVWAAMLGPTPTPSTDTGSKSRRGPAAVGRLWPR